MASLSQAPRLGYLPSPHVAFQEHAAHMARWPTMLNSKGSWSTCILQGLTTFLQCAFTAHRQPAIEGPVASAFEGVQECALSDILATSPDNLAKNRVMIAIEYKRSGLYACEFYRILPL